MVKPMTAVPRIRNSFVPTSPPTAMADGMPGGLTVGLDEQLPWPERIAELAHRQRRALLARRDGARIFAGALFPLPNALAYGEAMIGILRGAGLGSRDACGRWTPAPATSPGTPSRSSLRPRCPTAERKQPSG